MPGTGTPDSNPLFQTICMTHRIFDWGWEGARMLHWAWTASQFHSCWISVWSSFAGSLESRRALKNGLWSYRHLACQGGLLHLSLTSRQLCKYYPSKLNCALTIWYLSQHCFCCFFYCEMFQRLAKKNKTPISSLWYGATSTNILIWIVNPCPAPSWGIGRSIRIQSRSQLLWSITHANGRSLREPAPHPLMLNHSNE